MSVIERERTEVEERVADGVAFLDEYDLTWREGVDPETLDIADCHRCVLGQLFGDYGEGLSALGLCGHESRSLGFLWLRNEDDVLDDADVEALNVAWRRELAR